MIPSLSGRRYLRPRKPPGKLGVLIAAAVVLFAIWCAAWIAWDLIS